MVECNYSSVVSLTLYSAVDCPFCVRTRLVLDGKGLAYDVVELDLRDKPPFLRELNPRNRVPVLDDDGAILYESEALNEYLEETRPEPPMMPRGRRPRRRTGRQASVRCPGARPGARRARRGTAPASTRSWPDPPRPCRARP